MSSKSQNVAAQTAPASIAKPKNKLFGLSREELKIVTGGGGVIVGDPIFTVPGGVIVGTPIAATPFATEIPVLAGSSSTTIAP
jgi:hypothetical protein